MNSAINVKFLNASDSVMSASYKNAHSKNYKAKNVRTYNGLYDV